MNRTQRMKSHMGKARVARSRYRSARRHQQMLIADCLEDPGGRAGEPVIRVVGSRGERHLNMEPSAPAVRVIGPAGAPEESTPVKSLRSASGSLRQPVPPPTAAMTGALKPSSEQVITLAGILRGSVLGAIAGLALLLLYLALAG